MTITIADLRATLGLDTRPLTRGVAEAKAAATGLKGTFSGLGTQIGAAFTGAGSKIEALGKKSGVAGDLLGKLGIQSGVAGDLLSGGLGAGAIAAGAAVTGFALEGVHSFTELAESIRKFKEVSGASAEDSSRLVSAMHQLGIDASAGSRGFFLFGKAIAGHQPVLEKLGITIAKTKDGNTDMIGSLFNVADAFRATEDPAKRAQIAAAAFGRGGAALIPILERGRSGLKSFFDAAKGSHQILSQKDLDKALDYEIATRRMKDTFSGLSRELGQGLVPVLTVVANDLAGIVTLGDKAAGAISHLNIKLPGGQSLFGRVLSYVSGGASDTLNLLGLLGAKSNSATKAAGDLTSGLSDTASGLSSTATAAGAAGDSINEFSTDVAGAGSAAEAAKHKINQLNALGPDITRTFGGTKHAVLEWQKQVNESSNFVSHALSSLAGSAKLSANDVIKSFDDELKKMGQYRSDVDAVVARNAPADLVKQLADAGEGGAVVFHALATANQTQFERIVRDWRHARDQAPKVSNDIRHDFIDKPIKIPVYPFVDVPHTKKTLADFRTELRDHLEGGLPISVSPDVKATSVSVSSPLVNLFAGAVAGGAHAAGGFAPWGELAMFGEQGPELGIPRPGGFDIMTAARTRALTSLRGPASNRSVTVVNNVYGATDPLATARAVGEATREIVRQELDADRGHAGRVDRMAR